MSTRGFVCAEHAVKPAPIYHECVGCELQSLRERINTMREEIYDLENERDQLKEDALRLGHGHGNQLA